MADEQLTIYVYADNCVNGGARCWDEDAIERCANDEACDIEQYVGTAAEFRLWADIASRRASSSALRLGRTLRDAADND